MNRWETASTSGAADQTRPVDMLSQDPDDSCQKEDSPREDLKMMVDDKSQEHPAQEASDIDRILVGIGNDTIPFLGPCEQPSCARSGQGGKVLLQVAVVDKREVEMERFDAMKNVDEEVTRKLKRRSISQE